MFLDSAREGILVPVPRPMSTGIAATGVRVIRDVLK